MNIDYQILMKIFEKIENADYAAKLIYKKAHSILPETIYKFYSFTEDEKLNQKKLDCLNSNKIFLSSREMFNDPYDDKGYYIDHNEIGKYGEKLGVQWYLKDSYPDFKKICCFTANGPDNMAMWANYANNHQGYCVEYKMNSAENFEFSTMCLPVQYVSKRIDLTEIIKQRIDISIKRSDNSLVEECLKYCSIILTCVKHESWEYENEVRFCHPNNGTNYFDAVPYRIYIGSSCNKKEELINIAKDIGKPIYNMKVISQNPQFKMEAVPVNKSF